MKTKFETPKQGDSQIGKEKKENPIAKLTIYGAGKMTVKQRNNLAKWLENKAAELRTEGDQWSFGRFVARYLK